jgi:hypothetical protein
MELPISRSSSKAARPKRLQYDDADGCANENAPEQRTLAGIQEEEAEGDDEDWGYGSSKAEHSDSEEDPPSQFSTPLKTAYSRRAWHSAFSATHDSHLGTFS